MQELESIDEILTNLKSDPEYYNHGQKEQDWLNEERMS